MNTLGISLAKLRQGVTIASDFDLPRSDDIGSARQANAMMLQPFSVAPLAPENLGDDTPVAKVPVKQAS